MRGKYLKESCILDSIEHLAFNYFPNAPFVRKISTRISGPFLATMGNNGLNQHANEELKDVSNNVIFSNNLAQNYPQTRIFSNG